MLTVETGRCFDIFDEIFIVIGGCLDEGLFRFRRFSTPDDETLNDVHVAGAAGGGRSGDGWWERRKFGAKLMSDLLFERGDNGLDTESWSR